jgi:DNA repair exonuclease SbcCD ATPase subunit
MRIAQLQLNNWIRFKGPHDVRFENAVHAVVASMKDDPERSNWIGKSSFLEAFAFVLYGWHRFRTEDEWITRGESEGSVGVLLTDGTSIMRVRKRGKSTQLMVSSGGDSKTAAGETAQKLIVEKLGLTQEDFFATCFFEQKKMSGFITAKPADRMALIAGWFGLERLQKAEEVERAKLSELTKADAACMARRGLLQMHAEELRSTHELKGSTEAAVEQELLARETTLAAKRDTARAEVEAMRCKVAAVEAAAKVAAQRESYNRNKADLDALDKKVKGLPKPTLADLEAARARAKQASEQNYHAIKELELAKRLACGQFGGQCPVDQQPCPVALEINQRGVENKERQQKIAKVANEVNVDFRTKDLELKQLEDDARAADAMRARYDANKQYLAMQAKLLEPEVHVVTDAQAGDVYALQREADEAEQLLRNVIATRATLARNWKEQEKIAGDRHEVLKAIETHRAALAIFGRNGAQRRIAERALADITTDANRRLRDAGIDLEVSITWARETKGLATACDECGVAFPSSTKVRECERCSAPRGPKLDERLDVELSDRSGAAEDLAGVALNLAAGAWLRRTRGSSWGVAFIDEPFGALDAANRRAFATHLATMLRGDYGFEQAFVIAHDVGVMNALPARVQIVGDADSSRIEGYI